MKRTIVIAAGGTGGHLYPAQALAKELLDRDPSLSLYFVAGGLSSNRCFESSTFKFKEIEAFTFSLKKIWKAPALAGSLIRSTRELCSFYDEIKPDLIVGFGAYHSIAPILAARWKGCPIILHEANCTPGKANYWLGSFADAIALHFSKAAPFFSKPVMEVSMPLYAVYGKVAVSKEESLKHYNLLPNVETLLVFGGSQGASKINQIIASASSKLSSFQILHLTGKEEEVKAIKETYEAAKIPHFVGAYEKQMRYAWSVASLFLGRSGASTIAEAIHFQVPGVVVPYPYAGQHQEENGLFFQDEVKGGRCLLQKDLTPNSLVKAILEVKSHSEIYRMHLKEYAAKRPSFTHYIESFLADMKRIKK